MMPNFVFYSWQSDLPNATNRGLIERALQQAASSIRSSQEVVVDPVIDRDTAEVPGAPDIGATILEKIDRATAFVADVSITNRRSKFRPSPNPNVLIELGYALKALGWKRIILVANTNFGSPELLPFDLRQKRVITYHSAAEDQVRKDPRDRLSLVLEKALRSILEMPEPGREPFSVDSFQLDQDARYKMHRQASKSDFPMKRRLGFFTLVTVPISRVTVSEHRFRETFLDTGRMYSSYLNYSNLYPETHPDGYTRRARLGSEADTGDQAVVTCYRDGYVVTEGYIAYPDDDVPALNPTWFVYEVQRHLQLSKEVLADLQSKILLVVRLEEISDLGWQFYRGSHVERCIPYAGYHSDIKVPVDLSEVHGRDRWNIVCAPVLSVLAPIARIFGMERPPQDYWANDGRLIYASGNR